jgi:hypothetical protein
MRFSQVGDWVRNGGGRAPGSAQQVLEHAVLYPLLCIATATADPFTKTGSGQKLQTQGKHSKQDDHRCPFSGARPCGAQRRAAARP